MRWAAVAALLVLTSGCIGGLGDDEVERQNVTEPASTNDSAGFELSEPVEVAPQPNSQAEAAVSVSADGQTVLTCFHGFFTETSPGYVSLDGGETFQRVDFPDKAGPGGDCETAITPEGVWVFLASTVAGATVLVSEDRGETWTVNQLSAIPTNGMADRPWIEAVGEKLWLAYQPLFAQPGTIGFTKSTDYGESWSVPQHIGTPGPETASVKHGHFAIGQEAVYLPMVRYPGFAAPGERTVQLAKTTDGGESWTVEDVYRGAEIADDWPSLAVTEHGDKLFLVTSSEGGAGTTHVLHQPPGGAWTEPVPVHEPENEGSFWPWISGGHGRNATFILSGGEHEGTSHVWVGRIDASDLSVETWPVGPEPWVEFASVDHDAEGNAFAVWTDDQAQYLVKGTVAEASAEPATASVDGNGSSAPTPTVADRPSVTHS
jgi:hypothetical protein